MSSTPPVDRPREASPVRCVLGIDIGGTGSRAALEPLDATPGTSRRVLEGARIAVASTGSNALDVAAALVGAAADAWPDAAITAVGVGATGLASLVADPDAATARLSHLAAPGAGVALAVDALTAHLGALDGRAGAVVAVGTGAIALGTDLDTTWRRVGGWGHLWDDRGSGVWVGIEALKAAIRTHDGVTDDARALLAAAEARFGPAHSWPGALLTRADRAGLIAAFAPEVAGLAADGDAAASAIMRTAGREVAATLVAALDPDLPRLASWTGGMFAAAGAYRDAFAAEFARLAPDAALESPSGTPLDGAVRLARLVGAGDLPAGHPPFLWR
ncbi:N-acetylglucosamine kinase-like BadF-type ATPase [Agromyces terreus]|uniref:N-acetylglucosamine kinase-like BadF-type ATPase n=1 Tax=Agromyces terreus TaxID=424795 RepID=A0A9X2H1K6_9MICO|nr:BadF/BadG/BcrA/BcrD ATPase family protein [Agromyces terreus]MCP2370955.1 N-acetylglucosamine kinase-like BadF-type ATPase [Agromyces terreus]